MATIFGTAASETIAGSSSSDTIYGGPTTSPNGTGNDTVNAGNGSDIVFGGDGSDVLNGESNNDTLIGGAGNDTLNGGSSTDTADYSQDGGTGAVTVNLATGTATDSFGNTDTLISIENIIGTSLGDVFVSNVTDDVDNSFAGGAGVDSLSYAASTNSLTINLATGTATGNNIGTDDLSSIENITTGSGNDSFTASVASGVDNVFNGGTGTDSIIYSAATNALAVDLVAGTVAAMGVGTDTLIAIENVTTGSGNDSFLANVTNGINNSLNGGSGNDTIDYSAATNALTINLSTGSATGTGIGTDTLTSFETVKTGSGNDVLTAASGGSTLIAGAGTDQVTGGIGNDTLVGGAGNDTLNGNSGTDTVDYSQDGGTGAVTVNMATGAATDSFGNTDTLSNVENIIGTGLNDTIVANVTNGTNNSLNGGGGTDTVDYSAATNALTINLSTGSATGTGIGTDTLTSIETIRTGSGNDILTAAATGSTLIAGAGTDQVTGGTGNDTLVGGAGNDTLNGNGGTDTVDYGQDGGAGAVTVNMATGAATDSFGNTDTLSNIENITGTGLNDTIVASTTSGANNSFAGGAGTDTVDYSAATNTLSVNLTAGTVGAMGVGTDTLASIEIIKTGSGNDTFSAGAAGLGGVTTLNAGGGNDTLTTTDAVLDLTGKTLTGIEQITTTLGAGTAFSTDSIATALLIQGSGTQDSVTLVGAAFSAAQRTQLFAQGIESITDTSGTHTPNTAPTAVADTGNATEDGGPVILTAASLLANDIDPDAGDSKTIISVNGSGALGTVNINNQGNIVYNPGSAFQALAAGATTTDSFTYTMQDSAGAQSTATVTMTITGVNDAPTAGTVAGQSTSEDTPLTIAKALILAGAADVDGGTVSLTGGSALHGSVTLDVDGNLVYTPTANAHGPDTVTYTLSDGQGGTTTGTFAVAVGSVNDDPTAGTVAGQSTNEDTALTVAKAVILAGAADVDGDTVTLTGGSALHGTVSIDGNGDLVYTPTANANGPDIVTYTLSDGQGGTTTGSFAVSVGAVNDDPTAGTVANQATSEDTPLTVAKALILAGAGDLDGDTVTLTGGSALHGTVALDVNGDLVYTPTTNANGPDTVTYTLSDGQGGTTTGSFVVSVGAVNDDPTAGSVADQATSEDTPLTVAKALILAGAGDVDGDTVTLTGGSALHGTVALDVNGDLVYTPTAGTSGPDTITYTLSDGHGGTVAGTFAVAVGAVNDDPVAGTVADQATSEDTPLTVAKALILAGATDGDGDTVTLTGGSALHGTVSLDGNGDLVYTPTANANGPDTITYTLSDGQGGTATGTFVVAVGAVNDDPTAGTVADQATSEDTPLTVAKALILAGAGDVDGDIVTLTGGSALHGTVALDGNGDLVYTPTTGTSGPDTVTYTLSDGQGGTATGTFVVGVGAVNDDPTAGTVADQSTTEDTPLTVAKALILAGASDLDGDTVTLTGGSALHGTVSLDVNGDLVYTPTANANGP
ncbi:beta strand repeat-containing protein, partial [Inquilinus sp.]|uniref:beta strand repeat-containing protein n=1 Tax=Inquilinus sp. TaxID=1932117 RepID=UPI00378392E1